MDLLSNLIAYSALNTESQTNKRQERSLSVNGRFSLDNDLDTTKTRLTSKSLNKLSLFSGKQTKIDPRQRSLHRLLHTFNKKFRKYCFQFFVTLQTLKAKNVTLKTQQNKDQLQKINNGLTKVSQVAQITLSKMFEKNYKNEAFQTIKRLSQLNKGFSIINSIIIKKDYEMIGKQLFKYGKELQILNMKVEIFATAMKVICDMKSEEKKKILREFFSEIKESGKKKDFLKSQTEKKQNPIQEERLSLSPYKYNKKSKEISPLNTSKKVPQLTEGFQVSNFDLYQQNHKCCQILTQMKEKPMNLAMNFQSLPKMMKKLHPQELCISEVGDQYDRSNIFRFKETKQSASSSFQISNVVGDSFSRTQTIISDLERLKEPSDISRISYSPLIPLDQSIYSVNDKMLESNFGGDAVNFKNSLVLERESMKKNQFEKMEQLKKKNFLKKRTQYDQTPKKNQLSERKVYKEQNFLFKDDSSERLEKPTYHQRNHKNYSFQVDPKKPYQISSQKKKGKNYSFIDHLSWKEQTEARDPPVRDSTKNTKQKYSNQVFFANMSSRESPSFSKKFVNLGSRPQ